VPPEVLSVAPPAREKRVKLPGRGRAARPDERRLAQGLRRGDPEALAELHRTYGPLLFGYLRRVLGDTAAAEDVHQEVFLDAWRRGSTYDPERSALGTWLMVIARSRAIDHLRRRVPEPLDPQSPGAGVLDAEDPSASPELVIERWAMAVLVARLPEEQARILRMRFHEGLSQAEIAERTGIPLGTVKTYMVRGLRRLRELMEEGP
jgi:RNA polymerase sigma-70 factor (ECF subfamily)